MKLKKLKVLSVLLLSMIFSSCEIGLGTGPDQEPPKLTIDSPEYNECVSNIVTIEGTAKDNTGITFIDIEIVETQQFFRFNGNEMRWEYEENNEYKPFSKDNSSYNGDVLDLKWSITIKLDDPNPSGKDFTIVAQVHDKNQNDGIVSKKECNVTVDIKAPNVSIIEPVIKSDITQAESEFEKYQLKDNNAISKLLNGDFRIAGLLKDDSALESLTIYLDGRKEMNVAKEDLQDCYKKWEIPYESLRNWEVNVKKDDIPEAQQTGKNLFRIVTESYDQAGNFELKVLGWFVYWNEADTPWILTNIGGESFESAVSVYPRSNLQGQAYDDDGLSEVEINIYKKTSTDLDYVKSDKSFVVNFPTEKSNDIPTYYSWSFEAPSETCQVYVEIICKDIFGNKSETITRYMTVQDVNPPKIIIEEPASGTILLGDSKGDFILSGKIEDDGDIKDVLKVARISDGKEDTQIKYFSQTYSEWEKASIEGTVDSNGNKIWLIPLDEDEIIEDGVYVKHFVKKFNLFDDFGIDGENQKMKTQTLILYAEDKGDVSSINYYTYTGDMEVPDVFIDSITIGSQNVKFGDETKTLPPFNRDSDGKIIDKAILKGRWTDNSIENWEDKTKIKKINVIWEGTTVVVNQNDDGTWTTEEITIPDSTTAVITATLTDYAGNTGKSEASFFINSSEPVLNRVTSLTSDGSYGEGKEIVISMEFNKNVSFENGSSEPVLLLNNGKTATYSEGNRTSKHLYKYIVEKGDDIPLLGVSGISLNGNKWFDEDGAEVKNINSLPSSENLGGRTIKIDTVAPVLEGLTNSTIGYYGKGKEIFITATFSEEVEIDDVSKLYLLLNSGTDVKTSIVSKAGQNAVLFKYIVNENENASPLKATFNLNGCKILDAAGNEFVENINQYTFSDIIIDTAAPEEPVINYSGDPVCYDPNGLNLTVSFDETASIKKYSLDGGNSYLDYSDEGIKIRNNGEYNITAYAEDEAGNRSDTSNTKTVYLDSGYVLTSIQTNKPDGIYTTGDTLIFNLNFRKPVLVENSQIELNIKNKDGENVTAEYVSGSGSETIVYRYEIQGGDSCDNLDVIKFFGTVTDNQGIDITKYVSIENISEDYKFVNNYEISIVTGSPSIKTVSLDSDENGNNAKLIIEFDSTSELSKGEGSIVITQNEETYLAPAYLTKSEYEEYEDAISAYYEKGTNGASETGISDTSEKYILKFEYDGDSKVVTDAFKNTIALRKEIEIASRSVVVSGRTMTIDLSESYELPVKGASYKITIPSNIVIDTLGGMNEDSFEENRTLNGYEKPIIRINKTKETITNGIATQPLTADVKIDCQTPNVEIKYKIDTTEYTSDTITQTTIENYYNEDKKYEKRDLEPTSGTETEYSQFTIGESDNTTDGYKYFITAFAGNEKGYEVAYRTVVRLTPNSNFENGVPKINGEGSYNVPSGINSVWIRGGDSISGGVSTPGFPFSWDPGEYDMARLMTKDTDNQWYWVSWNINTTAYFGFLAGNVPNDAADKGPSNWSWATCAFVSSKAKYPLYPGHSINMNTNWGNQFGSNSGDISGKWIGNFAFQKKQLQQRNEPGNESNYGEFVSEK